MISHQSKPLPFSEFLFTCFTLLSLRTPRPAPQSLQQDPASPGLPTKGQQAVVCRCPGERVGLAQLGHVPTPGPINSGWGRGHAVPTWPLLRKPGRVWEWD